jgi:hypothetical protein
VKSSNGATNATSSVAPPGRERSIFAQPTRREAPQSERSSKTARLSHCFLPGPRAELADASEAAETTTVSLERGGPVPARYRFLPHSVRVKIAVIRVKCVSKSLQPRRELRKGKHVKSVGLSETRGFSNAESIERGRS